jgi:hypothetical protein
MLWPHWNLERTELSPYDSRTGRSENDYFGLMEKH